MSIFFYDNDIEIHFVYTSVKKKKQKKSTLYRKLPIHALF